MLLAGIALIVIGVGLLLACVPRRGKTVWFVGNPFLEPVLPVLMICAVVFGAVLVTGDLLDIDNIGLTGVNAS